MRDRLTVVLSQAQGKNPVKRSLEESLAAALLMAQGLDVSIVPYLYDLDPDHTGRLFLESITGDMVVLGWMFPRAAFWLLDRDGIKGHYGESRIKPPAAVDDDEDEEGEGGAAPPKGIGAVNVADRFIYCIDLREFNTHQPYVEEVLRIAAECRDRREAKRQEAALANPMMVQLGLPIARGGEGEIGGRGEGEKGRKGEGEKGREGEPVVQFSLSPPLPLSPSSFAADKLLEQPSRRWYPVIDYSRCTNCMECIDFCLFGVYGVDGLDRILVENQDSCKKGCPACSRVCPEHAIMFPDYKTPAIAGAPVGNISGLKIDLTRLFGGGDAISIAAQERDRELVMDGREAVGLTVGIPKRQAHKEELPKDDLDNLMDSLDALGI